MSNPADLAKKVKELADKLAKADADVKWEMAASAVDIAGVVDPTPASDAIGAAMALRKGDYAGAGMSALSMVPYLGDALAKPAKALRSVKRINDLRQTITKFTAELADAKKALKAAEDAADAAKQAKIATEAAKTAAKKAPAQKAAKQDSAPSKKKSSKQKARAKDRKDKDCKTCGTTSDKGTKVGAAAPTVGKAPKTIKPLNPGTRFYVDVNGDILDANTYARNSGFRKGVKDKTWASAVDKNTGLVSDPLSGKPMDKLKPWDMGHRPGMEFWKERNNAIDKWLEDRTHVTRKEFLDKMNDPKRYRPELPESNRSHRAEDSSDDFWD